MTEFTPTSAYKVTFNKASAHFLGQGTYPNGANLEKIEQALRGPMLGDNWRAARDVQPTAKTVHEDGSVSINLIFGNFATRTLQTVAGRHIAPAGHLQIHLQKYFDKESWGFRREMTNAITVQSCEIPTQSR